MQTAMIEMSAKRILVGAAVAMLSIAAADDVARSPMDWTSVQTNAIVRWKADCNAPSGVVVDKAARKVRVLMEATGLATSEPAEFFAIGPLSDRAYESMFVMAASPADIANGIEAIGVPRGVAPDPQGARTWPQGEKVSLTAVALDGSRRRIPFSELLDDRRKEEGGILASPLVYTGGLRDGRGVPVAATNVPCAVFALYTSPQSLLQLDGAFDQSAVYGRFCPKERLPMGGLYELEISWDGVSRVSDKTVVVTPENAAAVLEGLRAESANRDVFVRIAFGESVTVEQAGDVARAFSLLDGHGVKMNGVADGQFYYHSFLPDPEWRRREGRIFQPFEIRVAPNGARSFTFVEEDWSGDGLDPALKPHTTAFAQWRDVLPLIAKTGEQGAKVNVAFIFAPKATPVSSLSPVVAALSPRISTFYVFGE